jgi:integrase
MSTKKLTKSLVDALPSLPQRYVVFDAIVPGFAVRVAPTGHKSFHLKHRTRDHVQRKLTIGTFGALTVEQARAEATRLLAEVRLGADPAAEKKRARAASTVNEACDRYVEEHAQLRKKPSSTAKDEQNLKLHVRPRFGSRKIASITYEDIQRMHHEMHRTPGAANRCLALLSKMFNLCEKWGLRPAQSNPCRHVEKYPEKKIHRDLSEIEVARLAKVLRDAEEAHRRVTARRPRAGDDEIAEHPTAIAAVRLLLLTGCRRSEVLSMRLEEVDAERRLLRFLDSKTGAKTIALNEAALAVLDGRPRIEGCSWVFPSPKNPSKHFVGLPKIWYRLRKRAGLEQMRDGGAFRIHDFRHNLGATAATEGMNLLQIGKLLGHKVPATTARYAELVDAAQAKAANRVGATIAKAMGSRTKPVHREKAGRQE